VIVSHILHVIGLRAKLGRDRRQQSWSMPERYHLVFLSVNDECRASYVPCAFFVVKEIAEGPEIESVEVGYDLVDAEEGRVEDESANGRALEGGFGGEVAGGSRAKGSSVEDDLMGWNVTDYGEVAEGGLDVAVDHVFAGSLDIRVVVAFVVAIRSSVRAAIFGIPLAIAMCRPRNTQAVPRVIVGHDVHAEYHGQILHAIVHHAKVLSIAVAEEQSLRSIATSDEEGRDFVLLPIAHIVDVTISIVDALRTLRTVAHVAIDTIAIIGIAICCIVILRLVSRNAVGVIQRCQIALSGIQTHGPAASAINIVHATLATATEVVAMAFVRA